MGMEWMDKRDIWPPQKIAPMPGKTPGAEADAFNQRGPINTCPKMILLFTRKAATLANIMVCPPWQEELLKPSYNKGKNCRTPCITGYW